jgi:hypothetical protein
VDDPTPQQPSAYARSELAKAFTARLRSTGERGGSVGRLVVAGMAVVVSCALAVGIGALIHHKNRPAKAVSAAGAERPSLGASGSPRTPPSSPRAVPPGRPAPPAPPPSGRPKPGSPAPKAPAAKPKAKGADAKSGAHVAAASATGRPIVSYASNRCVDVTDGSSASGTRLQIWDCNGDAQQRWSFRSDGTVRALGKCLTGTRGANADGAAVEIASCTGGTAQKFWLNDSQDLVNSVTGKCVDVTDGQTGDGTRLQLWQCTGESNQKWYLG